MVADVDAIGSVTPNRAKRKFPKAKKIRVTKRLNWWERGNFNYF